MSKQRESRVFYLHFTGAGAENRRLPASLLLRAVDQVQRVVYLLARFRSGRPLGKRIRFSNRVRSGFELACVVPREGGYVQPIEIAGSSAAGSRITDSEAAAVEDDFREVAKAVGSGDADRLGRAVPNPGYPGLLIEAFAAALPPPRSGVALSIEDDLRRTIFDGKEAWENIAALAQCYEAVQKDKTEIIEKRDLAFRNVRYRADPPLRFRIGFHNADRLYDLRGDFGIEISAETRPDLEEALDSTLDMLWSEYALEQPENLSTDARTLRKALRGRIRETR